MQVAEPKELLHCLQDLVQKDKVPLEDALALFTSNPAKRLKLHQKGQVRSDTLGAALLFWGNLTDFTSEGKGTPQLR